MDEKPQQPKVLTLLRSSINTIFSNSVLLLPFSIIVFIQLLALEILFFIPRWPLNTFFAPIIRKLWSETFMHYPLNLALLPKLFYYVQIPLYIIFSYFFIAVAIGMIRNINNDEDVKFGKIVKELIPSYIFILVFAILTYAVVLLFHHGYSLVYNRALIIRSTAGPFFWLKTSIIEGAPYLNLLLSIFGTTMFAYVLPLIVIEKRKFFGALFLNLKYVLTSPFKTFFLVCLPSLIYVMVLLLRNHIPFEGRIPELRAVSIAISIFVVVAIDAVVYTAITTYYLIRKGQ